ncbi:MAG: prepilin-type N-terminal cleavage/methylation domain-containing protein [Deltaproteobacteria bacterium]|nr:prepilin-type N-terminal cleavage/methylation domain-containing protein [Deltaproteobacteria bacterium]
MLAMKVKNVKERYVTARKTDVKRRSGFSLVELMIAIAILGILASISSFAWQRYVTNTNLRTATRELEADFFLIKERSVSEKVQWRITLTAGANSSYDIEQGTAAGAPFTVIQTKSPASFGSGSYILDTTFGSSQITFLPRGTLSGSTGTVRLKNSRNSIATITINITGRTHVKFEMQ